MKNTEIKKIYLAFAMAVFVLVFPTISQAVEPLPAHTPGEKVVLPDGSTPMFETKPVNLNEEKPAGSTDTRLHSYETQPVANQATQSEKRFDYRMLEGLPGFFAPGSSTDLPGLILGIYNFGIWTVGIAAFFMLIIGGFMYMTSAGNTSRAGNAKGVIWDALLGIAVALLAYLVLYVINPDLTKIRLDMITVEVQDFSGESPLGTGQCKEITDASNPCSVQNMKKFVQGKGDGKVDPDLWAQQASAICARESLGGKANIASSVDICTGKGRQDPVSFGLFQINISAHDIGGKKCTSAFNKMYTKKSMAPSCYVENRSLYDECVALAKNPSVNIEAMWNIYRAGDGRKRPYSWWPWGVNSACRFSPGGRM